MTESVHDHRLRDTRRTSDILHEFLDGDGDERLTLGGLMDAMGDRAYGMLLLIFALPNMLPLGIPGLTSVLGTPLFVFAAQLAVGRPTPWIPEWLANRSASRAQVLPIAKRFLPYLDRAEKLLRPRWPVLTGPVGERVIGAVCFLLGVIIALPIPLGNILPSFAVSILALAVLERDGIAAAIGHALSLLSLAVVFTVVVGIIAAFLLFLRHAFG